MEGKKYKLINKQTGEEHLCNKITIGGFDYYVNDNNINDREWYYSHEDSDIYQASVSQVFYDGFEGKVQKVIATNNPNIDIPKVVDEVELLAKKATKDVIGHNTTNEHCFNLGYNKSQETHPFNEEDMFEFVEFVTSNLMKHSDNMGRYLGIKKVLQIWKKERPIKVYYEKILY